MLPQHWWKLEIICRKKILREKNKKVCNNPQKQENESSLGYVYWALIMCQVLFQVYVRNMKNNNTNYEKKTFRKDHSSPAPMKCQR